jgi:hypothetical protein
MECQYKTQDGRLVFKIAGDSPKKIFSEIAAIQDLFEAETSCGICGHTVLKMQHRKVESKGKTFDYYELVCRNPDCRARLSFGQAMVGEGLFPKRKGDDDQYLPNRGWQRYVKAEAK